MGVDGLGERGDRVPRRSWREEDERVEQRMACERACCALLFENGKISNRTSGTESVKFKDFFCEGFFFPILPLLVPLF